MARSLIIGCGCRGGALARALRAGGQAVRGTTRTSGRLRMIEAAGAEAVIGDPDRVATIAGSLERVTLVCVLLGSAAGSWEQINALHGPRLEMLLTRMLDSTVRGVVYEAAGSVDREVLRAGAERVCRFCERSMIPHAILAADPADHGLWLPAAVEAVERVIATR